MKSAVRHSTRSGTASAIARAVAAAALVLGSGCSSKVPQPHLPQPPAAFREAAVSTGDAARAAAPQPQGAWWKVFDDPLLERLMDAANRGNTSIQAAAARLAKARALARGAGANRMPQVSASGGAGYQGGPLINAAGSNGMLWTLSASASYEPDLFGRLAKELDAATLDVQAREALLASAHLMVQADMAQSYFALRLLDAERAVVRDTVAAHQATLQVSEQRFALGAIAELELARLRADVAAAEADALALDRRRAEVEHALAVLAGETASTFQIPLEPAASPLPVPLIPPGIPSTVLARRPDVAAAQRSLLAAQSRLGVAQSAWFPSLSLTTAQGYASTHLTELLATAARAWSVGALLSLPLLDGGRRQSVVAGARADLDAVVVAMREQLLAALREVEDQLAALRLLDEQARAQSQAVTASHRATALAHSRYDSGLASQLEVLDAQRSELRYRRQALQLRALQYQATVGLIRALGGGWDNAPADRLTQAQPQTR